ncbi:MAG: putative oxidoreductase, partial [Solirubrobacterales bacterium]|nr:putative oxidoreductase [Solirubrobacterales bacterium]
MGILNGRIAVITGAGRGIGREHALLFAREGGTVVVNDLGTAHREGHDDVSAAQSVVDEITAAGGTASANTDNVATFEGAGRLVQQAVDTYGRLDVVVNNAGILRDRMLTNMTEQEWDAVINVHLKGSFAPMHHAAIHWKNRSKAGDTTVAGRVINTTSVSGVFGNVGQTNYGAAKAGIAAMTIIAARELQRYNVTVNAISPHALTRMTEDLGTVSDEARDARDPRWIAPVVVWLASRESGHVTGRVIDAGGG